MAENGNGKDGSAPQDWGPLITHDEMADAFALAKVLGMEEEFGNSSPLGGIVVLMRGFVRFMTDVELRVRRLEKLADDL